MLSARSPLRPLRSALILVTAAVLAVSACDAGIVPQGSAGSSSSPAAPIATPASTAVPAPPSAVPASPPASPEPSAPVGPAVSLEPGAAAATVSDAVRVRSQPRVADDSVKHTPVLPKGAQLLVIEGPVEGSGYTWVRVAPIDVQLDKGVETGWVAVADHDGTPWVAPVAADLGFELVAASAARPKASVADARAEAKALNAFGVAMYKRMLKDEGLNLKGKGVAMSPYSIVTALAMARAGAKGATATDMDQVLRVAGWKELAAGLGSLDQLISSRDATWKDYNGVDQELRLRSANMTFAQDGFPVEPAYLDAVAKALGSGLGLVDYMADPEGARKAINGWVSAHTMGRIPELIPQGVITDSTRLELVNAVYLKAAWRLPFDEDQTKGRTFTTASGAAVKVPTMLQRGGQDIPLAKGDGWKATELFYESPGAKTPLAMTLILPDDLAAFERSLSTGVLAGIGDRLKAEEKRIAHVTHHPVVPPEEFECGTYPYSVSLYLPKFGVDTHGDLVPALRAMGMDVATDSTRADFSGMSPGAMFISSVVHQANIDVDEKGTTAAAATAVGMDTTGGCGGPQAVKEITLRFNRPFLYFVRDVQTGAILFMGRVADPTVRG